MKSICVFCGASKGARPIYVEAARHLGSELVRRNLTLVYGGGRVGIMGEIADAVLRAGGRAVGVIPKALAKKEVAHTGLSELHVVGSMHERKALMADLADAFIALPGGFGTFEEFFEVLTWSQLGLHKKPCGVLNIDGYYDPFVTLVKHAVQEQFVRPEHAQMVVRDTSASSLLDQLAAWKPVTMDKWISPEQR